MTTPTITPQALWQQRVTAAAQAIANIMGTPNDALLFRPEAIAALKAADTVTKAHQRESERAT